MSKRILITGAGGFVGTHLIQALLQAGETNIYAATYKSTSDITDLIPADHILAGDLTNYSFAESLVKQVNPEVIYHLAALSVVHNSAEQATSIMNANTTLQYNILEAVRLYAPQARFLAVCSANEYGLVSAEDLPIDELTPLRPLNPYAVSKVAQEMLALQYHLAHGLDVVIVRPFNHTGAGQTTDFVVPMLAKQFAEIAKGSRGNTIEVGNLETARDYTDVHDMVAAYLLAVEKGKSGEIYNIGTGKSITVHELIKQLENVTGKQVITTIKEESVRIADVPILVCDATKFKQQTGWEPKISLVETLQNVYNYWKELV